MQQKLMKALMLGRDSHRGIGIAMMIRFMFMTNGREA